MIAHSLKKISLVLLGIFALWLCIRYLLPLLLPFLLGWLLARLAEPVVCLCRKKYRMGQPLATAIGVTGVVIFLCLFLSIFGAVLFRLLYRLAASAPDLESTAKEGLSMVESWAMTLAHKAPKATRPILENAVARTFGNGDLLMEQLSEKIPGAAAALLGGLPNSALLLGTALLSGYMISCRLPKFRRILKDKLPDAWQEQYLPALRRSKSAIGGWLRAQGILLLMIYCIVTLGFFLLKIPYGPFWALLIALMDAVPLLGTGLVLVPWAFISFLTGNFIRGIGLAGIFLAATAARSIAEPKLLGKHLGLDPLLTLMSLYIGYRLWGFLGLLLAPVFTAAVKSAWQRGE